MAITSKTKKQNNGKRLISGMNVGSSSILVTFVLLCLVTFAALSFVSANSDHKLSLQTAKKNSDYYEANRIAEEHLANIEKNLVEIKSNTSSESDYFNKVNLSFCNHEFIACTKSDNNVLLSYEIKISEIQTLCVSLTVNYPNETNQRYFTINKWQNVSSYSDEDLNEDTSPKLLF